MRGAIPLLHIHRASRHLSSTPVLLGAENLNLQLSRQFPWKYSCVSTGIASRRRSVAHQPSRVLVNSVRLSSSSLSCQSFSSHYVGIARAMSTNIPANESKQSRPVPGPFSAERSRVGWVGVGVMGNSMAGHLLSAGYKVSVFNRTAAKCGGLKARGATVLATPAAVAAVSDVVFAIVGLPTDVEKCVLGPEGILSTLKPGGVFVDMTTSSPGLAKRIYEAAAAKGCFAIDAPVSGGDIGAREAKLSIMAGGDKPVFDALEPLFNCMGKNLRFMGPAGSGQHTKMVNQILISTMMIGVCEGLIYGHKAGLDLDQVIAAVGAGAAGSWTINNLGPRIVKGNFEPGFFVEHFIKDLGIALDEAKSMGLSLPGLALAHQLYLAVQAQGYGRKGTQALFLALQQLNGVRPAQ